jgi:hypothetical protein
MLVSRTVAQKIVYSVAMAKTVHVEYLKRLFRPKDSQLFTSREIFLYLEDFNFLEREIYFSKCYSSEVFA